MSFLNGLQGLNLFLRFILEVCALIVAGYWGVKTGNSVLMKVIFGIGAPLGIAVVWGTMGSPKAIIQLPATVHLILEIFVFGLPIVLLLFAGKVGLAWIYGITLIINKTFMYMWNQ
ncbi:YrdB family protein [Metabacillus arenae]|uniref:YrdB family protein n=1 Tax=Metabacillus arenae TaxID=2771434 RepID=A0A926NS59_9BACI|nr:YrdB family protein [Metabacillus arenae]MBD1382962.1 YrdB family protein [Metabacillus arenae]